MAYYVYSDALEHAIDYLGGTPDALALRDARRAVQSAYRDLVNVRTWSYLYAHDRVMTNAPYITGFVAYEHSGGLYERQLLLYQGTWPAWVGPGCRVRIGVVTHDVAERRSDTVLTLAPAINPGQDVDFVPHAITGLALAAPIVVTSAGHGLTTGATVIVESVGTTELVAPVVSSNGTWVVTRVDANRFSLNGSNGAGDTPWDAATGRWRTPPATTYSLYQDDYPLPPDFIKCDTAIFEGNFGGLTYADPTDQLWFQRFASGSGVPRFYCIRGSTVFPGRLVLGLFPYPDQRRSVDFIYERRPRDIVWEAYGPGTVTLDPATTVVTVGAAAFEPSMAGSVLRVGTALVSPTSWLGPNPPDQELLIREVLSPQSLRLAVAPLAATAVRYSISDPIDIDLGSMQTAFFRGIEKQVALARHQAVADGVPDPAAAYTVALKEAMAADSRSFQGRSMGPQRATWVNPAGRLREIYGGVRGQPE